MSFVLLLKHILYFNGSVWFLFSDVGRIGIGICYDIRFQELAMLYAARGMPSSSTVFVM
jgi:hypothetical protein